MHRNKECQWWIDRCPATEINIEAIKFVFGWIFMFRAVLLCFTLMPMPLLIYIHIFIYFVPDALPIVPFFLCLVSCLVSSCVLSFFFIWNKKVKKNVQIQRDEMWVENRRASKFYHARIHIPKWKRKLLPNTFFSFIRWSKRA